MKKQIIKITRKALTALLVLFTAGTTMAQVHTLQLSMQNVTNPTPNTVEFEMWIKNMTPDSVSKLSFLQFGIDLPANIGNGGTLSCSKIAANPLLPATQQAAGSPAVQLQPATPTIRVAAQTTSEGLAAVIPSTGNGIWYGTYRITNTAAFAANAVMTFTPVVNSSPSTKTRTSVAAYVNGAVSGGTAFTVLGSTTLQSALRVLGIAQYPSITLNQPAGTCPTAGNANVTDPICFGGLGSASITLSPAPVPVSGSYSVDGGAPASYTTNPFTVGGLSQGTHTVTVTNNPNCAPFDVVFNVGGPSSIPTNTTTQSACDNYTWSVTGMNYTQSGTYTGTSVNTQGCTVNEVLDLTINLSGSSTQTATACDSYFWSQNGQTYTQSGTYTATGTTPAGCPDVHTLILTINNSTVNTQTETACDSYTWSVNNMMYTQSGTYTASGTNAAGCPSTDILVLTINNSITTNETASACGSYTWNQNNMTYTQSGTYTAVGTTAAGCQDLHILDLTITPSTSNTTVASACDSYTWSVDNMMYTQSGTYTSVNGCHTEILDLTITPSTSNTTVASACDSYTWSVNNMMYTQSGTYTSVNGCNTEILVLTLGQSTSSTITANASLSYTWTCNNVTYTQSGTYTCTGVNATGCPDVQTLILTISGCNLNVTTANASGCPNSPITLTGSPAGGTWSVANPYIGPSTTFTYTYTDPNTGCTGTATGTITVANLAAVTITSVTITGPTTATVNWTPVAGLSWYEVRYRVIGASGWTNGGTQAAPTNFKNLIGLTAGTTYEIEVRGFCSLNNPGPWGSNTVFTTSAACGTPSGLFAAPVTGTTAKLNYVAVPGASFYQFRMRKVGVLAWSSAGTQAAPATSKTIVGLSLNTQYEWQMRAVCTGNAAGAWSTIDMFTTLASKESVDFATETINNNVSVYPNPVRDVLTVEVTTEVAQNTVVKVFDMSGRLVKQIQANAEIGVNNIAVNLSDVSAGVYQVQVFANDKLTHISKVSKQD